MSVTVSPVPVATPETRPYWEGLRDGELRLCRCRACAHVYFPPSNVCPRCRSLAIEWTKASGRATLYSYVISEKALPEWGIDGPMSVAHVILEEGPALVSTIVNCPQTAAALRLDMRLRATFRPFGLEGAQPTTMLCFEPDLSAMDERMLIEEGAP